MLKSNVSTSACAILSPPTGSNSITALRAGNKMVASATPRAARRLHSLHRTRAMRAACCLDWYRHGAGGTIFRYWRGRRRGALHPVDRFHHQKNAEGDDQEIDHDGNEIAVGKNGQSRFLRRIQRHPGYDLIRERDVVIAEVQVAEDLPQ